MRRTTHTDRRPILIYGSTREMVEAAEAYVSAPAPTDKTARQWYDCARNHAESCRPDWYGACDNLAAVRAAANDPAPHEIAERQKTLELNFTRAQQSAPRVKWTREESGEEINPEAAAMLVFGVFDSSRIFYKQRRTAKPARRITIIFPAGLPGFNDADDYAERAYILAAAAAAYTAKGFSVAVWAEFTETIHGRRTHTVFYPLKRHGEALSTAAIYYGTRADTARRARFVTICREQADLAFYAALGKPDAIGKRTACAAISVPEDGTIYFDARATPAEMRAELARATATA